MSVFDTFRPAAYPYRFEGTLLVNCIAGGVPTDPNVARGWIATKLGITSETLLQQMVAEVMLERGISSEEAIKIANEMKNLNGFKRDEDGGLYIEGRQLKSALKEAISVSVAAGKLNPRGWGKTNKGISSYFAEHVFVVDTKLYLGATEATGINQRFISTFRGTGISYEEYVENAKIDFTVEADHDFSESEWATIWLVGEKQGIGAARSQGYGTYEVIRWNEVSDKPKRKATK